MPTGYTADIVKGITFETFALNCARAFGALISMRDASADAKIPDTIIPSDHHIKALEEAQSRLAILDATSEDGATREAKEAYEIALQKYYASLEHEQKVRDTYDHMLEEVQNWQPPTSDHAELKKFMIDQITESIEFDCGHPPTKPILKTPQEWLTAQKESVTWDIDYHTKEHKKETVRCKKRTEWVQALKKSLK